MKITGTVKASNLLNILSDHIKKYGDGPIIISQAFSDNNQSEIPCGIDMTLGEFAYEDTRKDGTHTVQEHHNACCIIIVPQETLHSGKVTLGDDVLSMDANGNPVSSSSL